MKRLDLTLAILAGGKATRLGGVPKGLLRCEGEPLLDRQLRLAEGLGLAEVLLVTSDPAPYREWLSSHPGVRTIGDLIAGHGSPGGVHAALAQARTPWVLAIAADMPWVTAAAVETLFEEAGEPRLACFSVGGRLQPFPGLYACSLATQWASLLERQPSFPSLFQELTGRVLPEEKLRRVDPDLESVANVNRPEDRLRWKIDWPIGWKGACLPSED